MRQIHIRGAQLVAVTPDEASGTSDLNIKGPDDMVVSDGYHSLDELYKHRVTLWIALCRLLGVRDAHGQQVVVSKKDAEGKWKMLKPWRSRLHHDGSSYAGWFLLGLGIDRGRQITYHLPLEKWEETEFAETLDRAPDFDGHTSWDVLERLAKL